jgi:hypothetical protein
MPKIQMAEGDNAAITVTSFDLAQLVQRQEKWRLRSLCVSQNDDSVRLSVFGCSVVSCQPC